MLRKCERGATAVEFAFLAIPLILLLVGSIEFGFALYARQAVVNASREGARAGTVFQMVGGTPAKANAAAIQAAVTNALTAMGLQATPTVVPVGVGLTNPTGNPAVTLTITVTYPYASITGLPGLVGIPNPLNLTASTVMMHE